METVPVRNRTSILEKIIYPDEVQSPNPLLFKEKGDISAALSSEAPLYCSKLQLLDFLSAGIKRSYYDHSVL